MDFAEKILFHNWMYLKLWNKSYPNNYSRHFKIETLAYGHSFFVLSKVLASQCFVTRKNADIRLTLPNVAENDPTLTAVEKAQKRASLFLEVTAVTTANSVVTTFSNGSLFPSLGPSDHVTDPVGESNINF